MQIDNRFKPIEIIKGERGTSIMINPDLTISRIKMQSEKEFKELAQAWVEDGPWIVDSDGEMEIILDLMWRSYNQAIEDYVRQDS